MNKPILYFISLIQSILIIGVSTPVHAVEEDSIQYLASGNIDPNSSTYLYAPSVMWDAQDKLFKFWACGGVAGDYVIYKESPTFDGLNSTSWRYAFSGQNTGKFDTNHTCDPSVIEHDGLFYLHYSGLNQNESPTTMHTRLGVAISYDRGRTFQRLFNGDPILEYKGPFPQGSYGIGQSAVAKGPDGKYYMIYSDITPTEVWLRVIRSPLPSFPKSMQEPVANFKGYEIGGVSLDFAYNRGRGRFEIIVNNSDGAQPNLARVRVVHLNHNFQITGSTTYAAPQAGFLFGEGIGIVKTPIGDIVPFSFANQMHLNFVASTFGPPRAWNTPHITGPQKYARFGEGPNGVLTNFSKDGDIALAGDLDGDNIDDNIIVDPITFNWKWKLSTQGFAQSTANSTQWGLRGDIPVVVRDWDKNGKDEIAVYRAAEGKWYILHSGRWGNGRYDIVTWGLAGDIPFSADTNGDRRGEVIVWRPSEGKWYVLYSGSWPNAQYKVTQFGRSTDDPFIHDSNKDGKDDFLIWRFNESKEFVKLN